MPVMNGLEAIKEIRAFYNQVNSRLRKKQLIQKNN
jgi:CheY-like chemotaxis protein